MGKAYGTICAGLLGLGVLATGLPALAEPTTTESIQSSELAQSSENILDVAEPTAELAAEETSPEALAPVQIGLDTGLRRSLDLGGLVAGQLPAVPATSGSAQDLQNAPEVSFTDSNLIASVQLAQDPALPPPTTGPNPIEGPTTEPGTVEASRAPTGPNYVGVGGSLGAIESTFGDPGAFALISKFRLTSFRGIDISVRPSLIVGSDATIVVPFTLDLAGIGGLPTAVVPYVGPGFSVTTADGNFYFTVTGGLDFPIGQFTANAAFNIGFLSEVALGFTLGVGYNF